MRFLIYLYTSRKKESSSLGVVLKCCTKPLTVDSLQDSSAKHLYAVVKSCSLASCKIKFDGHQPMSR